MTIQLFVPVLLAGFLGGVIRGVVGFVKHQFSYKDVKFSWLYFVGMMFVSGIVGIFTAAAVEDTGIQLLGLASITPGVAFIAGYAGGDFIENLYKIIFKKTPFLGE